MAGKRKSMMLGTPINQPPAPLEAMPQPPRLTPPPRTASAAPAPNPGLGLVAWPGEGMMSPPGRLSPKGSIGSSDEHASPHSAQSPLLGSPAANMMREADGSTPLMRSERLATNMRGGGGDMSEFSPEPVTMSRHHSVRQSGPSFLAVVKITRTAHALDVGVQSRIASRLEQRSRSDEVRVPARQQSEITYLEGEVRVRCGVLVGKGSGRGRCAAVRLGITLLRATSLTPCTAILGQHRLAKTPNDGFRILQDRRDAVMLEVCSTWAASL